MGKSPQMGQFQAPNALSDDDNDDELFLWYD